MPKTRKKVKGKMTPKYAASEVFEHIRELADEGKSKWAIISDLMDEYSIEGDEALDLYMGYLAQEED